MRPDDETCYRAVQSRDPRFDGWFYTAVRTTGIYCRPSCPARTPDRRNVTFHPTAAAAQLAGYRACKRCRPDASPGSPEWDQRSDVTARAMRLIGDGVVDREGVPGLAGRLGYSRRQLERLLRAEVGASPLALARQQRAQTARTLVEGTGMTLSEVAFSAGFGSVRQFNDTIREVFACSPGELRRRRRASPVSGPGRALGLRLAYRPPLDAAALFGHLAARAVPGLECWDGSVYRRLIDAAGGPAEVALRPPEPDQGFIEASVTLADLADLVLVQSRLRRLLDLDADPVAVDRVLSEEGHLAASVARHPGLRVPHSVDGAEAALRIVLGQQVSVAAAVSAAGRLAQRLGQPVATPASPGLERLWPRPEALAGAPDSVLRLPARRAAALRALAGELASGRLDLGPGADREDARAALARIEGIGPWTVEMIAWRVLADPDAFPAGDLGIRRGVAGIGAPAAPSELEAWSARWRPWRAYAAQHLLQEVSTPMEGAA